MNDRARPWYRTFLIIFAGQAFSLLGSAAVNFALVWWLTATTGSAGILAYASIAALLPQALLGLVVGPFIDRWDRRLTMIAADTFIAATSLVLLALFALGSPSTGVVIGIVALRSVGAAFHTPASQAAVPMYVPAEHLMRVAGWNYFLVSGVSMAGPVLGAFLMGVLPMAGVRSLERQIGQVARKVATRVAEKGPQVGAVEITADKVPDYLGRPKFLEDVAERVETPGVATGLAWTPVGGDVLFLEATRMPGSKGFMLTGQLGDVMKESAQAALSWVRNRAKDYDVAEDFFTKSDLHLHIPAGATPKDGPSAGVTMATALVSLLTGRPVRKNVGMTGEITLRGQVLPIGGVKEKVLAAHRYGLTTVILPKRNEGDLEEVPEAVRKQMNFIFAERVEEVIAAALTDHKPDAVALEETPVEMSQPEAELQPATEVTVVGS